MHLEKEADNNGKLFYIVRIQFDFLLVAVTSYLAARSVDDS